MSKLVDIFREVKRVMKPTGTCFLNLGDSYAGNCSRTSTGRAGYGEPREGVYVKTANGLKSKDLYGIPWRVAFALQADGWHLRQDIIWAKSNPMPESATDRCTKSHEYIFLLTKSAKYFYDNEAIKEPCVQNEMAKGFRGGSYCNNETFNNSEGGKRKNKGNYNMKNLQYDGQLPNSFHISRAEGKKDKIYLLRNKRSVWTIGTRPYHGAHFATFPPELPTLCIKAGCPKDGIVLDPFAGSGTTLAVAKQLGRKYFGIELNPKYVDMANKRISDTVCQLTIGG